MKRVGILFFFLAVSLIIPVSSYAQQEDNAEALADVTLTQSTAFVKLTTRFHGSFSVVIKETSTGCVWLLPYDGTKTPPARNVGIPICRGVSGRQENVGWPFFAKDGWSGAIWAKAEGVGDIGVIIVLSAY